MAHQSTILVVDDNEALRYAITRALQAGGYKVLEASTGLGALQLARQTPDLITLDIKLPDIDGFEVCRRLRSEAETKRIPVLHISASFVAPEDKVRALEGGADGYLGARRIRLLACSRVSLSTPRRGTELPLANTGGWSFAPSRWWFGTSTDITEEKRREEMLRQTERLALAGRLAASIAHEINNPLEAVTNIFYILETSPDLDPGLMDMVHIGSSELKRVAHIVRQSLSYYKNSEKSAEVKMSDLLEETLRVLDHHLVANRITTIRKYEAHAKVNVFSSEIRQVFSNLILNAVEAMPDGGQLTVKTSDARDRRAGGKRGVRVTVGDTGVGIAATDRARIFDAFFTTKREKGTGLGLWVSNDIITKHGGNITARSSTAPGRSGTVFSIFLPAE